MTTESIVAEICELARGPARPVLEKACLEWLEGFKQASAKAPPWPEANWPRCRKDLERYWQLDEFREQLLPRLPYPLDERSPDFRRYCAALAAFHDQNCSRCKRKPLFPEPKDDLYGGSFWVLLRDAVRKDPNPSSMREILGFVGTELRKRGLELPAVNGKQAEAETPDPPKHPWGNDDPVALLSPRVLADRLGIPVNDKRPRDNLRKRLEVWRKRNFDGGWIEIENRKPRDPQFLYPVGKAWPLIEDMKPTV